MQGALYPLRAIVNNTPVTSQTITVSTAAIGFTSSPFVASPATDGVSLISFDIQTSDVRVRFDGVDPTSTTGHILPATTAYTWTASQFLAAKFIRDTTSTVDAVIWASAFMIS